MGKRVSDGHLRTLRHRLKTLWTLMYIVYSLYRPYQLLHQTINPLSTVWMRRRMARHRRCRPATAARVKGCSASSCQRGCLLDLRPMMRAPKAVVALACWSHWWAQNHLTSSKRNVREVNESTHCYALDLPCRKESCFGLSWMLSLLSWRERPGEYDAREEASEEPGERSDGS